MKDIKLTPRQVMYRLERYEENEQKLQKYKETIKKELNRLRKVESRYKQHIQEHGKFKAKDFKNFGPENVFEHHRVFSNVKFPSNINKDYVIVANKNNLQHQMICDNLNINVAKFFVDELASDDILLQKIIILIDNTELMQTFTNFNSKNIVLTIETKEIVTIKDLNNLVVKIRKLIK